MAQPSKAGAVFLTIFALPFLGGGLFFLYAQLTSPQKSQNSSLIVGIAIALFFVIVGAGLILGSIKGYGILKKQAALQEANPTSPWLWRSDWAVSRADSQSQKSYIGAWVLAALGNLFLFPFLFGMVPQLFRQGNPLFVFVLAFGSLGIVLTVRAIRATIRHERFGNSYFEFDALPFSFGQRVTGRIHLRFETQAAHGIDLRLSCVRRIVSGSGKNSTTSNVALWESTKNVPSDAMAPGPLGRAIPVDFELPAEGFHTDHTNLNDQVLWLLHAKADVPGVNYADDFELPVFRTAASPQSTADSEPASGFGFASVRTAEGDSGSVPQPARTKVVVSMHDGGTEFYFPAFRTPLRALMLFLVAVIFTGAVYALFQSRVPFFFSVAFALFDLFAIYGFFHVAFGSARIFVGNGEIVSRGGAFGLGAPRHTAFSKIASIVPIASLQQGSNSDGSVYLIRMLTTDGKKFTLADEISSRQEARWIVSQIETLVGLKVDTHVEMDLPLGVGAQPPQVQTVVRTTKTPTSTASLVSYAIFAAMVATFFAWQGKTFFARRTSPRTARAATAPRPHPVARRVFSEPLSDSDVERVLALPPQDQAEELFERAIGHDMRALEVFNKQVEEWIGHIHSTDRTAQLLQRAQFSKDLRIRLAHVDMSLALEGWRTNQQAADQLMERARTDPQYRAWAVYYLGMLAGRGVDYDRIHRVLLAYARNDKDASVRQWAVEGLRFLGKEEALDDLFVSFTQDPAMNVRDRAGCNISDCGIFTRYQRARMVPKFIALAAEPNTSAQMRSWCFLALREITDENVPADVAAWNQWYTDHGTEKMAAFERLEWWQVRGND